MPRPKKYASSAERQSAYRVRLAERRRAEREGQLPRPPAISNVPAERRWTALREQAQAALQQRLDEMQAYVDERSEEWQESDRGQAMQERLEALEALLSDLESLE